MEHPTYKKKIYTFKMALYRGRKIIDKLRSLSLVIYIYTHKGYKTKTFFPKSFSIKYYQ